ncbi:hypothetical protein FACS1894113_4710 [Alphaproteobacteria bacterium]|nr:hypothetical protein FACS1894113_4710 [Alphaproteobacteria bacterium]
MNGWCLRSAVVLFVYSFLHCAFADQYDAETQKALENSMNTPQQDPQIQDPSRQNTVPQSQQPQQNFAPSQSVDCPMGFSLGLYCGVSRQKTTFTDEQKKKDAGDDKEQKLAAKDTKKQTKGSLLLSVEYAVVPIPSLFLSIGCFVGRETSNPTGYFNHKKKENVPTEKKYSMTSKTQYPFGCCAKVGIPFSFGVPFLGADVDIRPNKITHERLPGTTQSDAKAAETQIVHDDATNSSISDKHATKLNSWKKHSKSVTVKLGIIIPFGPLSFQALVGRKFGEKTKVNVAGKSMSLRNIATCFGLGVAYLFK